MAAEHQSASPTENRQAGAATVPDGNPSGSAMDVEPGSAKRQREDVLGASQERRPRQHETMCKMVDGVQVRIGSRGLRHRRAGQTVAVN